VEMVCVYDFHDLCPRLSLWGSFNESRKFGVMEFGINGASATCAELLAGIPCPLIFSAYSDVKEATYYANVVLCKLKECY